MIQTERLTVRRVAFDDWRAIQAIQAAVNLTVYAKYDRPNATDDASVMAQVRAWTSVDGDAHQFYSVCLAGDVIGYIALHQVEDGFEVGYCFHPNYHGHGYARESISALLAALGAQGVSRVTAGTALANAPSVKLLRALGFRQIGTERVSFERDARGCEIFFDGGRFERQLHPSNESARN